MSLVIRPSTTEDVILTAIDMRKEEKDEIWATNHEDPTNAILESCRKSEYSFTVLNNGKIVCMFGVVPITLIGRGGTIWMLTTNEIENCRVAFIRRSSKVIRILIKEYGVLFNMVDARHRKCIKWLDRIGARIFPPVKYGVEQMPFHYFTLGGQ